MASASRVVVPVVSSILLSFLSGCGDGAAPGRWTSAGGIREIRNTLSDTWPDGSPWTLTEDLRLGVAEGGGPEEFSVITALHVDDRGTIRVLDLLAQEVRVFDSEGRHLHTIGGKGGGPAEFSDAKNVTVGPGDTVWVSDQGANRYSAFSLNGILLADRQRSIRGHAGQARFLADGSYIEWAVSYPQHDPGGMGGPVVDLIPVRLATGFQIADSFPPVQYARDMLPDMQRPQPFFSRGVVTALSEDGSVWFAHSDEYRIIRRRLHGDTLQIFSLPAQPAPVGDAERDYVRTWPLSPARLNEYIQALPATKPIIHRIVPDGNDHVYVFPEVAGSRGVSFVDVFHASGRFIGRMQLPVPVSTVGRQSVIATATRHHIYVVVQDESSVPYVSRLRVNTPRGGT